MEPRSIPNVATLAADSWAQPLVTAEACGKAIIIGEHAVVYGARAVAMPLLPYRMSVQLRRCRGDATNIFIGSRRVSAQVNGVVEDAFKALNIPTFASDIEGKVALPVGAGLGSSATLCVVILRALSAAAELSLSEFELATLANQLEKRFHGKPSGLDTAVVAYEKIIEFKRETRPRIVNTSGKKPFHFCLIDSGVRSQTINMIKLAAPYFTGKNSSRVIDECDALAQQTSQGLECGDHAAVADAMNQFNLHLQHAGVVSSELADIIAACKSMRALAAKPTGAGGGGTVLALLDSENPHEQMRDLRKATPNLRHFHAELP